MALRFFLQFFTIDRQLWFTQSTIFHATDRKMFNSLETFLDNRNCCWIFQHELNLRCWVNETRPATVVSAIECVWRVERCRLMLREKWKMLREWNANRTAMKLKMKRKTLWSFPLNSWTFFSCDHEFARLTDYIDWKLNKMHYFLIFWLMSTSETSHPTMMIMIKSRQFVNKKLSQTHSLLDMKLWISVLAENLWTNLKSTNPN